jgi:hypothetical protein
MGIRSWDGDAEVEVGVDLGVGTWERLTVDTHITTVANYVLF